MREKILQTKGYKIVFHAKIIKTQSFERAIVDCLTKFAHFISNLWVCALFGRVYFIYFR